MGHPPSANVDIPRTPSPFPGKKSWIPAYYTFVYITLYVFIIKPSLFILTKFVYIIIS